MFIYTFSFDYIVMFNLIYVMFLFVEHIGLSATIGAAPYGVARPGAVVG
jgi:hypothetical protein